LLEQKRATPMDRKEELRKAAERCAVILREEYNVKRAFLIGSLVMK